MMNSCNNIIVFHILCTGDDEDDASNDDVEDDIYGITCMQSFNIGMPIIILYAGNKFLLALSFSKVGNIRKKWFHFTLICR